MGNTNTYTGALIEATRQQQFRDKLMAKAPVYPRTIEEGFEGATHIATKIRVLRNDTYYLVPLIESSILGPTVTKLSLYNKMHTYAYHIKEMFVVEHSLANVEIDPSQEPEPIRLLKLKII